jgi:hypothetical protein
MTGLFSSKRLADGSGFYPISIHKRKGADASCQDCAGVVWNKAFGFR